MISRVTCVALAAIATFSIAGGTAHAQNFNPSASGHYGAVRLNAGFTPDPHSASIRAGGSYDAANLGSSCRGMIAARPDYSVDYTAGSWPLRFYATAEADTTLVVRLPDGSYLCDDDGGDGLNPLVHVASPRSGRYQVWVGTYSSSAGNPETTLNVTELSTQGGTNTGAVLDFGRDATYGSVTLRTGFTPDPQVVELRAGGSVNANEQDSQCSGWVTTQPDYEVSYTAGGRALIFSVQSDADTTLVINGADGRWHCDDDTDGVNPQIRFESPQSGTYDVWVGTYASGANQPARLSISESARPRGK
jgi:hypothetical protein